MDELVSSPVSPRTSNPLLRQVVVIATILSLATAYGWMASFDRQPGGDMASHWSWATAIWGLVGAASSIFFWRKIWPPKDRPPSTRGQIIAGSVVLLLPGLWWLTSPLWSLSRQTFRDVGTGLVAAAMVLTFGAWMVTRLIKAFESSDTQDLADEESRNSPQPVAGTADNLKSGRN